MKERIQGKAASFFTGFGILAGAALVAKLIGAFYRIPLTNIIGADGTGLYQLVYPVFTIVITLASGGVPMAVSRLVSERTVTGDEKSVSSVFGTALVLSGSVSLLLGAGLYLAGGSLAGAQGNTLATSGYFAVAPAVFFVGILSVLRGYYQGRFNMAPTALSQIVEQAIKLIAGLLLASLLLPYGTEYGVAGALLGVTASEIVAVIVMFCLAFGKRRLPLKLKIENFSYSAYQIFAIALPVTVGALIMPLTQFIDSMLVLNLISTEEGVSATAQYGMFTGPVSSTINLPVVITIALGIALVPAVSRSRAECNLEQIRLKSNLSVKLSLVFGVFCGLMLLVLARPIMDVLYPSLNIAERTLGAKLLAISSISVLSLSLIQIYTALLQGIGLARVPVAHLAVAAGIKLVLDIALLGTVGIYGAAISSLVCYGTAFLLNMRSWHKRVPCGDMCKIVSVILFSGVIITLPLMYLSFKASAVWCLLAAIPCTVLYGLAVMLCGLFDEREYKSMPFGKRLFSLYCRLKGQNND